jgi:GAF domain-containing protein
MRRRSRTAGGSDKTRRRKTATPKHRSAPKAKRNRGVSIAGQETVVARLTRERDEALLREIANSEILRLISSSPGDLELVFRSILENATRICNANFGTLLRFDGQRFHPAAQFNTPTAFWEELTRRGPFEARPVTTLAHLMETIQVDHVADTAVTDPQSLITRLGGARTLLNVPMIREKELIGVIGIYRQEVRPFTEKQIALVQNFAAQAVIAIENARLLNELRESLDRQTATADILRVIAGTPEDSNRALDTIAETASRMFGVANVNFRRIEGDVLRIVSSAGPTPERLRKALPDIPLEQTDPAVRCFLDNRQIPVEDRRAVLANERGAIATALRELPVRSQVFTPLSRQGKAIGVMIVTRGEVKPFQQGDLDLMKGFADQAVIAIENARLLSELRESLEQQTATADVLRVISSSQGQLQPVFEALLANAVRLCEAKFGVLYRYDGHLFHPDALVGVPQPLVEFHQRRGAFETVPGTPLHRLWQTRDVVHTADDAAGEPPSVSARFGGARSHLAVPMFKGDALVGSIVIYRQEVRLFTDKQIELVKNFAAQAVIAIENARLLNELRERTDQLEAQSQEVLKLNQQLVQRVADQVGEIERMGRLRRFLPPQVADLIVASGTEKQLESHRREITALFCDLRGFTGFSESSDPEDVMALLRDYHAAIGEIIIKYSGTLERLLVTA